MDADKEEGADNTAVALDRGAMLVAPMAAPWTAAEAAPWQAPVDSVTTRPMLVWAWRDDPLLLLDDRPVATVASAPVPMGAPPSDGLFGSQFYLLNEAPGEFDLRLFATPGGTSVWDDYTGAGIQVGMIDDGIDAAHTDLDDNYDASLETVSGLHPDAGDAHGTAVAGIIVAENNGVGTVGLAYDATITSMAAISIAPNLSIASAIANAVNFDVVNNSWGYTAPWIDQYYSPGQAEVYAALDDVSLAGRNGLGTVFVKSAGNGRTSGDNANFSGLNSHWGSITVAAVDRSGSVSQYSTEGAALLVSAFGTPFAGEVVTTDRTGAGGYDAGDYTSSFNGTSAAAPMVSGIVALMLEANPELGYRDVSQILAMSARHVGSAIGSGSSGFERYAWEWNGSQLWNGRGLHFSEDYGFGLVDALAAVRLAESWSEQGTRYNLSVPTAASNETLPLAIPDNSSGGLTLTFTLAAGTTVEQMRIDLGISHSFTGDLVMTLTSPSGTVSQLLNRNGGGADIPDNGGTDIWLTSHAFLGEESGGTWTLFIADLAAADVGAINGATLLAIGSASTDDTHVLTNEASLYMTPGDTITDANGGDDTLNASAVSGPVTLDLLNVFGSSAAGVSFVVSSTIEHLVSGDGNDVLVGSAGANLLSAYRGDDLMDGYAGDDTLDGGTGTDTLYGSDGNDLYRVDAEGDQTIEYGGGVGTGTDTVESSVSRTLGDFLENLVLVGTAAIDGTGNAMSNAITGNDAANRLEGGEGQDTLDGAGGNDTLVASGSDIASAGDGDDWVINLQIAGGSFDGGAGIDTLDLSLDLVGYDGIYDLRTSFTVGSGSYVGFENLIGSLSDEAVFGNAAINVIQGGGGDDTISGAGGNDALSGNGGHDVLGGGAGNDTLNGNGGADVMVGGVGSDTYVIDSTGDVVSETSTASGDIDTVFSSVSRTLSANVEVLTLTGGAAVNATGNTLGNRLNGNAAVNRLDGAEGADTMAGGLGGDTYVVDDASDLTTETSTLATEIDTVLASVTRTLGANLENLTLTGGAAINATGNALANRLLGNGAANVLNGSAGNDTLIGGLGNDSYVVDSSSDVVTETSTLADEIDTVFSSVARTLGANLENLTLTGNAAANGGGNALDNRLLGNAGLNALTGNDGDDLLDGGLGNDTLAGGNGLDTFRFTTALDTAINVDRINGFVTADDRLLLDDAVFVGIGALGQIDASAFHLGAAAADAGDRIVYNAATGQLFFDADGSGAGAATLFATLGAGTVLGADDVWVA